MTTATTTKTEYRYEIEQSEYIDESPRDWCTVGTMALFHSRYNLPNESIVKNSYDYNSWEDMEEFIMQRHDVEYSCILPVYMYDHGGVTINTTGFSCGWDSGKIGFIFIDNDTLKDEGLTEEQGVEAIRREVSEYDQYLRGDVYDILIYKGDELIESHCNYYGYDYAEAVAKDEIEALSSNKA
jgi:hypothetical protein